ncbi:MAG: cytochrome-c peroxidase [Bdellovibrio sp.]|nr:MAG: cytochrome-c peroxidase [Bdellovibrio sp.]
MGTAFLMFSSPLQATSPLPEQPPIPKDNPLTKEKIELGKQLFFDPRLSLTGTVSCNSCHNVMSSGTDNTATSTGVFGKKGGRNAPTVWNSAFLTVQFWDGRAASLEEQAKGPLVNPVEMGMKNHQAVVKRIKKIDGYVKQFKKVFKGRNPVTIDNVAKAIAAYERTLITVNSPFDRYLKGDKKALSASAKRGWKKFQEIGCISCHSGPNFSGPTKTMGVGFFMKFPTFPGSQYDKKYRLLEDKGRYEVTKKEEDKHMWRVPTLRNVALTAPYFHNGAVKTLPEAVRVMAKTQLNKTLSSQDVKDLVSFLKSLTGEFPKQTMPRLPEYRNASLVD